MLIVSNIRGVVYQESGLLALVHDDHGKYVLCLPSVFWPCDKASVSQTATV